MTLSGTFREPGYKEGIDHDLDQLKIDVGVVRFEPVEVDPTYELLLTLVFSLVAC